MERAGRVVVEAVRVRLAPTGRLLTVIPEAFSASAELCVIRDLTVSSRTVRQRAGWAVLHVRTGLAVAIVVRRDEAFLLMRLLDRQPVWAYEDGNPEAVSRALERCFSILANFDVRAPRPARAVP